VRYLDRNITEDLKSKMVFISGPRQTGKTTLVQMLAKKYKNSLYLNYDSPKDRKKILNMKWTDANDLLIFDEIHKYSRWKNFVKGIYDTEKEAHRIIVTGSSRLDIYRRGQDSMFGRFFPWRLHPFCLAELKALNIVKGTPEDWLHRLINHSGFPEPFLKAMAAFSERWRQLRTAAVFRQDIREIEQVKDIALLEMLYELLRSRVGGAVVNLNLARDLDVAPKTVKSWLAVMERSHAIILVYPYTESLSRAILKPPKIYFYDNGEVIGDHGAKFENLVATHLLKRIHFLMDSTGHRYNLHYLRDKEKHEVDFVIVKDKKPIALIEAKWSDSNPHHALTYFGDRLGVKTRVQLVAEGAQKKTHKGCVVWPAADWLSQPLGKEIF